VSCIQVKNRTIKPIETVLREERGEESKRERGNLIKIYCKHSHVCHNGPFVQQ
jgi:hypothetical protein